ncbi:MAG: transposase [Myxococcales bacterium]|nr:transposase [Myxococcales bacterium]
MRVEPLVRKVPNDPRKLRETFGRLMKRGRVQACYEAGACGFEIQRMLDGMGVACQVVAPSLIPSKPGDRVKTDRRDAVKLVRLLRADELTAIVVPTSDQEAARDLVELATTSVSAHRSPPSAEQFLLRHGRHYTAGVAWTQKHGNWLKSQIRAIPAVRDLRPTSVSWSTWISAWPRSTRRSPS